MTIKVRFAPSPTGLLHVGNLRTALVNWLFARRHGGHFLLRFDDTDRERSRPEFADAIEEDLRWLGLLWDSRARQSERLDAYEAACERLRAAGRLYPCYETADELEYKRKRQLARGRPPIYDRAALRPERRRAQPAGGAKAAGRTGASCSNRGSIVWDDLVRGRVELQADHISDPVVVRADGTFLYMLPSTVDDVDLGVTHVIRGEDHVANTAVQIQMFRALGAAPPVVRASAAADRHRRTRAVEAAGLDDHRQPARPGAGGDGAERAIWRGSAPASIPQPGQTLAELAADFDIARLGRATPKFDENQLEHLNHQLLRESAVRQRRGAARCARARPCRCRLLGGDPGQSATAGRSRVLARGLLRRDHPGRPRRRRSPPPPPGFCPRSRGMATPGTPGRRASRLPPVARARSCSGRCAWL